MSSVPPPNPPPANQEKPADGAASPITPAQATEGEMDTTPDAPTEETWDDIPEDVISLSTDEILTRIRLIENDIKVHLLRCSSLELWLTSGGIYRLCGLKR